MNEVSIGVTSSAQHREPLLFCSGENRFTRSVSALASRNLEIKDWANHTVIDLLQMFMAIAILEPDMNKIWFIAGALSLAGCSSSNDAAEAPATIPASTMPEQVVVTVAPTAVQVPVVRTPEQRAPVAQSAAESMPDVQAPAQNPVDEQGRADDVSNRQSQVAQLRLEIRQLERQKSAAQQRWDSSKSQREQIERKDGVTRPEFGVETFARNEVSSLDNNIAGKQREIDNLLIN